MERPEYGVPPGSERSPANQRVHYRDELSELSRGLIDSGDFSDEEQPFKKTKHGSDTGYESDGACEEVEAPAPTVDLSGPSSSDASLLSPPNARPSAPLPPDLLEEARAVVADQRNEEIASHLLVVDLSASGGLPAGPPPPAAGSVRPVSPVSAASTEEEEESDDDDAPPVQRGRPSLKVVMPTIPQVIRDAKNDGVRVLDVAPRDRFSTKPLDPKFLKAFEWRQPAKNLVENKIYTMFAEVGRLPVGPDGTIKMWRGQADRFQKDINQILALLGDLVSNKEPIQGVQWKAGGWYALRPKNDPRAGEGKVGGEYCDSLADAIKKRVDFENVETDKRIAKGDEHPVIDHAMVQRLPDKPEVPTHLWDQFADRIDFESDGAKYYRINGSPLMEVSPAAVGTMMEEGVEKFLRSAFGGNHEVEDPPEETWLTPGTKGRWEGSASCNRYVDERLAAIMTIKHVGWQEDAGIVDYTSTPFVPENTDVVYATFCEPDKINIYKLEKDEDGKFPLSIAVKSSIRGEYTIRQLIKGLDDLPAGFDALHEGFEEAGEYLGSVSFDEEEYQEIFSHRLHCVNEMAQTPFHEISASTRAAKAHFITAEVMGVDYTKYCKGEIPDLLIRYGSLNTEHLHMAKHGRPDLEHFKYELSNMKLLESGSAKPLADQKVDPTIKKIYFSVSGDDGLHIMSHCDMARVRKRIKNQSNKRGWVWVMQSCEMDKAEAVEAETTEEGINTIIKKFIHRGAKYEAFVEYPKPE